MVIAHLAVCFGDSVVRVTGVVKLHKPEAAWTACLLVVYDLQQTLHSQEGSKYKAFR